MNPTSARAFLKTDPVVVVGDKEVIPEFGEDQETERQNAIVDVE